MWHALSNECYDQALSDGCMFLCVRQYLAPTILLKGFLPDRPVQQNTISTVQCRVNDPAHCVCQRSDSSVKYLYRTFMHLENINQINMPVCACVVHMFRQNTLGVNSVANPPGIPGSLTDFTAYVS